MGCKFAFEDICFSVSLKFSHKHFQQKLPLHFYRYEYISLYSSYCLEETIGFDVKTSFARRPVSHLIEPSDITNHFLIRSNKNNLIYFGKQLGKKGERKFSASRAVSSCNMLHRKRVTIFLS